MTYVTVSNRVFHAFGFLPSKFHARLLTCCSLRHFNARIVHSVGLPVFYLNDSVPDPNLNIARPCHKPDSSEFAHWGYCVSLEDSWAYDQESNSHVGCTVHLAVRDVCPILDYLENPRRLGHVVEEETNVRSCSNSLQFRIGSARNVDETMDLQT